MAWATKGARLPVPRQGADALPPPLAGGVCATLAFGLIPDFLDVAMGAVHGKLNDDVDEEIEQRLNVRAAEILSALGLLDEQHELLEGQLGTRRMETRDRARVPGVHIAQVVERFLRAQLREQYAVRSHAQAGFEELLWRDPGQALFILRVEEAHVIRVGVEGELLGVLNRNQALLGRNLPNQRLGVRRFAGTRGTRHHDVL